MTAAQCHRSAAKTRPPDATQKKPDSGNHFPTSDYAKLSQAGEVSNHQPGWRFVSIVVTLAPRGCDVRQEPYIPGALSIL